jgi:hypothetical protein
LTTLTEVDLPVKAKHALQQPHQWVQVNNSAEKAQTAARK